MVIGKSRVSMPDYLNDFGLGLGGAVTAYGVAHFLSW